MHRPMHRPACPSTKHPKFLTTTFTHQNYMILLLFIQSFPAFSQNTFFKYFSFLFSAIFSTIIQACFNLQLAHIFVRTCVKMSTSERSRLKASAASEASLATVSTNVEGYLHKVVSVLEGTGLFIEVSTTI